MESENLYFSSRICFALLKTLSAFPKSFTTKWPLNVLICPATARAWKWCALTTPGIANSSFSTIAVPGRVGLRRCAQRHGGAGLLISALSTQARCSTPRSVSRTPIFTQLPTRLLLGSTACLRKPLAIAKLVDRLVERPADSEEQPAYEKPVAGRLARDTCRERASCGGSRQIRQCVTVIEVEALSRSSSRSSSYSCFASKNSSFLL